MLHSRFILFWSLVLAMVLSSCNKKEEVQPQAKNNTPPSIVGYWISPQVTQDSCVKFRRSTAFIQDNGYAFQERDRFISRGIGYCGTKPYTYLDIEGTWTQSNQVVEIQIHNPWMPSPTTLRFNLVSLTDSILILQPL